jgi:hypothetical protein
MQLTTQIRQKKTSFYGSIGLKWQCLLLVLYGDIVVVRNNYKWDKYVVELQNMLKSSLLYSNFLKISSSYENRQVYFVFYNVQ